MANSTSTYQAGVVAASGSAFSPNKAPLARKRKLAAFTINCPGSNADGDYFDLGSLQLPGCYPNPESIKIRFGGSGSIDAKFTFKKVDSTGANAVALTAQSAEITAITSALAFTAPGVTAAGTQSVLLAPTDMLRLYVNYGTGTTLTLANTVILYVEVPYDVE